MVVRRKRSDVDVKDEDRFERMGCLICVDNDDYTISGVMYGETEKFMCDKHPIP